MISLFLSFLLLLQQPKPDVVVIVLDDVGLFDVENVELPSIKKMAADGLYFNRFYGSPTCAPARFSLMFGKYGLSKGNACNTEESELLDINWLSLPKSFKEQLYNTAFFGKWHLGSNNIGVPWESTPSLHGFDYTDGVPQNIGNLCDAGDTGNYNLWIRFHENTSFIETGYNTLVLRDSFINWWTEQRSSPKFAYIAFSAPHSPFHIPPSELVPYPPDPNGLSSNRWKYEQMLMSVDTVLSQMLEVIDLKNTYVIIVGDNGTPPNASKVGQQANKLKTTTYEGGIKIPCIIIGPNIEPGTTDSLSSLVDILPTISELIGTSIDESLDGHSLVPIFKNRSIQVHDHIFSSDKDGDLLIRRDRAVVQQRFKLRRTSTSMVDLFYDLKLDPAEVFPLNPNAMDPAIVQSLRDQMNVYIARGL